MRFLFHIICCAYLVGCAPTEIVSEDAYDQQLTAFVKNGNPPRMNQADIEKMSRYDFLHFANGSWELPHMRRAADSLRVLNPDINLGDYYSFFTVSQWMARADTSRYPGRWWRDLSPYLAVTTEGDTASFWNKSYCWDICDPEARAIAVNLVNRYVRENGIGHLMMDWMTIPMADLLEWQPQEWQDQVHGDVDWDRDGIGHWDDPDEQEFLRQEVYKYVKELRAALPESCLLIPNGGLAVKDPVFAKLVDGCYLEQFPWWLFGSGDAHYANAVDPDYPNSLWELSRPDRWRTPNFYVMLEDKWNYDAVGYIAQCFDRVVHLRRESSEEEAGTVEYPPDLVLGRPLGPPVFTGDSLRRFFERGALGVNLHSPTSVTTSLERN